MIDRDDLLDLCGYELVDVEPGPINTTMEFGNFVNGIDNSPSGEPKRRFVLGNGYSVSDASAPVASGSDRTRLKSLVGATVTEVRVSDGELYMQFDYAAVLRASDVADAPISPERDA